MHRFLLIGISCCFVFFDSNVFGQGDFKPLGLTLPTENKAIFSKNQSQFYMYTNRNFEGVRSTPWTAGKYGFVRNQRRSAEGIIMTRFHEGIDIRPLQRDKSGNPLDMVRAIAPGKVVHVNSTSSHSSYGKYVVVEHDWGYGPFYSLSAHLMDTRVKVGQKVTNATVLGRLGYTGNGIDRTRAHVHLELNLLLSKRFESYHKKHYRTPNYHGNFNGINLAGLDIAGLYQRQKEDPSLSIPEFLTRMEVHHKALVPRKGNLEILSRYPFLGKNLDQAGSSPSWEIHFSRSGIPLQISPSSQRVSRPTISWVKYSKTYHSYLTRGRLTGSGSKGGFSDSGLRYIALLTGQF
tara:strand:+ start:750 stop:1796 length:1047 start_codon:yes stop_codon:yes gene_type:complete